MTGRSQLGGALARRRLGVGDDDRAVGGLVGVEAAPGLAAEQPGGDHLLEDRRRSVQPVAALPVHRVEDLVRRVEPDQVEQRERPHRVAAAEPHRRVDVLAGRVVALVHRDRVVEIAEQQRVGDEAGLVADRATGFLSSLRARSCTSSTTSGSVTTVRMTSTNFCTGAGLKKCIPMTRPGCEVAERSFFFFMYVYLTGTVLLSRTGHPRASALRGRGR